MSLTERHTASAASLWRRAERMRKRAEEEDVTPTSWSTGQRRVAAMAGRGRAPPTRDLSGRFAMSDDEIRARDSERQTRASRGMA